MGVYACEEEKKALVSIVDDDNDGGDDINFAFIDSKMCRNQVEVATFKLLTLYLVCSYYLWADHHYLLPCTIFPSYVFGLLEKLEY